MKTRFLIFTQAFTALCFCLLAPSISTDAWTGPRMRKSSVTSGPLSFANLISSIRFGRKWQFQATGGSTPYTFSLAAGTGSVTAGGLFTAPATSSGSSTVRVTDNASAQVNNVVNISVTTITMTTNAGLITSEPQGIIVDSGGTSGNYSNDEFSGLIIRSTEANTPITLTFESFGTESGYDYLYVYDGEDWGTLLGQFDGSSLPPALTANSGSMLIWWESDGGVDGAGFKARWNSPCKCLFYDTTPLWS